MVTGYIESVTNGETLREPQYFLTYFWTPLLKVIHFDQRLPTCLAMIKVMHGCNLKGRFSVLYTKYLPRHTVCLYLFLSLLDILPKCWFCMRWDGLGGQKESTPSKIPSVQVVFCYRCWNFSGTCVFVNRKNFKSRTTTSGCYSQMTNAMSVRWWAERLYTKNPPGQ